jgi:hypothetical protein
MHINDREIDILHSYHKRYFRLDEYIDKKKPNIERFMRTNNLQGSKRFEYLLSMYYFKFWRLSSIIRPPDRKEIYYAFLEVAELSSARI